jgi:ABC-type nickel/cobalt efflux system permease component RcnA
MIVYPFSLFDIEQKKKNTTQTIHSRDSKTNQNKGHPQTNTPTPNAHTHTHKRLASQLADRERKTTNKHKHKHTQAKEAKRNEKIILRQNPITAPTTITNDIFFCFREGINFSFQFEAD